MPAVSPDGTKIAFSTDRDGDAEVYSMNAADGSSATGFTDSPTVNADPDWQPLLDTTPPDVTLTAPSDGAAVSGPSVTLSAGASDTKRVARVDFYVGSRMVGTDSTAGGPSGQEYSASLNSTTLPDGPATVEAHAMKRVGGQRPAA